MEASETRGAESSNGSVKHPSINLQHPEKDQEKHEVCVPACISPFGEPWRVTPMKKIAEAGLLVAFLDRRDQHHNWAAEIFERQSPSFYTADPILAEVAAVLGTADDVLRMVETGDLELSLDLAAEVSAVQALIKKYKNVPMDLGDACCVRLAELLHGSVIYTVDKTHFQSYRKNGRQPVPCVFPDAG